MRLSQFDQGSLVVLTEVSLHDLLFELVKFFQEGLRKEIVGNVILCVQKLVYLPLSISNQITNLFR